MGGRLGVKGRRGAPSSLPKRAEGGLRNGGEDCFNTKGKIPGYDESTTAIFIPELQ